MVLVGEWLSWIVWNQVCQGCGLSFLCILILVLGVPNHALANNFHDCPDPSRHFHLGRNHQSLKNSRLTYGCLLENMHREKSSKHCGPLMLPPSQRTAAQTMKNLPGKLVQQAAQSCLGGPTAGKTQNDLRFNHPFSIKHEESRKKIQRMPHISTFINPNIFKSFQGPMHYRTTAPRTAALGGGHLRHLRQRPNAPARRAEDLASYELVSLGLYIPTHTHTYIYIYKHIYIII